MFCRRAFSSLKVDSLELTVVERRGRFVEERNFELILPSGGRLLAVKCFAGRKPYWSKWVEVFAVAPYFEVGGSNRAFAGSELEKELLQRLSAALEGGDLMYVEYAYDPETEALLRLGAPPAITRLGHLMLQLGFTKLRDWYWPEGFMEGGQKLQGERPASREDAERHLNEAKEEVRRHLPLLKSLVEDARIGSFAWRALERALALLSIEKRGESYLASFNCAA